MKLPPKSLKTQIVLHRRSVSPILSSTAESMESLPVLQAFQEFLQKEREKAQRQLAILTTFFVFLVVLLLGGASVAAFFFFGQIQDDVADLRREISSLPHRPSVASSTQDLVLAGLSRKTAEIQQNLDNGMSTIARTRTNLDTRVKEYDMSDGHLRNFLSQMDQDNAKIRREMAGLLAEWPRLTNSLISLSAATPPTPTPAPSVFAPPVSAPLVSPPPASITPVSVARSAPAHTLPCVLLSIAPQGRSETVTWRLPIPE